MTRSRSAAGALLLALALAPAHARAQGDDARVLPRGWVEFRATGFYTQFDTRFAPGGSEALGETFSSQLTTVAQRVLTPVVEPLVARLDTFFAKTAASVTNPTLPVAPGIGSSKA